MMKILITGKNGHIGKAFIEYMSREHAGDFIIDTVSLRDTKWRTDDWSGYDAVVHLVGVNETCKDKETVDHINRALSISVAKKAKESHVGHFLFASTMMVYGQSAPIGKKFTISADTDPNPASEYGITKLAGEDGILALRDGSFKVSIVRECVVYGKHFDGEFQKLLNLSRILPVFPVIDSKKSYIYEDNLSELFRQLILDRREGIFCPQNYEQPTSSELFMIMRHLSGKKCLGIRGLEPVLKLMSHITRYVNAVFNDMKYTKELSVIDGIDYNVCSLEESIKRCL